MRKDNRRLSNDLQISSPILSRRRGRGRGSGQVPSSTLLPSARLDSFFSRSGPNHQISRACARTSMPNQIGTFMIQVSWEGAE